MSWLKNLFQNCLTSNIVSGPRESLLFGSVSSNHHLDLYLIKRDSRVLQEGRSLCFSPVAHIVPAPALAPTSGVHDLCFLKCLHTRSACLNTTLLMLVLVFHGTLCLLIPWCVQLCHHTLAWLHTGSAGVSSKESDLSSSLPGRIRIEATCIQQSHLVAENDNRDIFLMFPTATEKG